MKITFSPIDELAARIIISWRYEPPYDVYNIVDCDESLQYVLTPQLNFFAMRDGEGQLIGFCSFGQDGQVTGGEYNQPALDIGMGIRPDLTGQGHGTEIVAAVLDFARQSFAPKNLRVTIAAFNLRAQRVWQKNGFRQVQAFKRQKDGAEFVILTSNSHP